MKHIQHRPMMHRRASGVIFVRQHLVAAMPRTQEPLITQGAVVEIMKEHHRASSIHHAVRNVGNSVLVSVTWVFDRTWYFLGVLGSDAGGDVWDPKSWGMARYPKISTNLMDLNGPSRGFKIRFICAYALHLQRNSQLGL